VARTGAFTTLVIAHVAFCTAYVTITVQIAAADADRRSEEAAMDLGSSPAQASSEVTLAHHWPAAGIGLLLSFTLSLDDL